MGGRMDFFKDQLSLLSDYIVKLIQLLGVALMIYFVSKGLSFDTFTMALILIAAPMVLSSYLIRLIQLLGVVLLVYAASHDFSMGMIIVGLLMMASPLLRLRKKSSVDVIN